VNIKQKNNYFYPTIFVLFLFDIFSFSLCEKQVISLLLCFYIMKLYKETTIFELCSMGCLMCLESSLYYSHFGLQLLYLIPASFIGLQSQKLFYVSRIQPYLLLTGCLLVQYFLIEPIILDNHIISNYTPVKIIANIIVLWCVSLTDNSQGKLGNRFAAFKLSKEESPDS